MTRVRSLQLNDQLTWRGGERQTLLFSQALQAAGHDVVLAAHPQGELCGRAQAVGLEVFPLVSRSDASFKAAWQLRRFIREWRPDVLHAHTSHAHSVALLASCRERPRPRLLVSRRVDRSIHRLPLRLSGLKYRFVVDRYIAISQAVRRRMVTDGIQAERIGCVFDGLDPAVADATEPADLRTVFGFPPEARVLTTVAALDRSKGHHVILAAVPAVLQKYPTARFLFVGAGPEEETLREQIQAAGLDDVVILAGFRHDVLSLIAASAVFVMPSLSEGLCTSVMDAMFLRTPVVVSNAGGLPELIEDRERGRVVPMEDSDALAEAILETLTHREQSQHWAMHAHGWALEHLTVEAMMQGTLREYAIAMGG